MRKTGRLVVMKMNALNIPCAVLVVLCSMSAAIGAGRTYQLHDKSEAQLISLVLKSEIESNSWTPNELICFSVEGLNPSSNLVKNLRKDHLNVRSIAEWNKLLNCEFEVRLTYEYTKLAVLKTMSVHAEVLDLRDINAGSGHIATTGRTGNYSVVKADGNWTVKEYSPAKP
jgi:hypothetical protein